MFNSLRKIQLVYILVIFRFPCSVRYIVLTTLTRSVNTRIKLLYLLIFAVYTFAASTADRQLQISKKRCQSAIFPSQVKTDFTKYVNR